MKDLLDYIVKNLVSKPEEVLIDEQNSNGNVDLYLTVDPSDMGLIIGKGGQTIRAIRKLLTVRAIAESVRVNLQLNEPEGGKPEKEEIPQNSEASDEQNDEAPVSEPPAEKK